MKPFLPYFLLLAALLPVAGSSFAQPGLLPDQNPNYAVSRDKYMKLADSLTGWHSTTLQETYKAIDWLADRQEARDERREFRRQLRMERLRWNNSYIGNYSYPAYRNRWSGYPRYFDNGWHPRRGAYLNPWHTGWWWR